MNIRLLLRCLLLLTCLSIASAWADTSVTRGEFADFLVKLLKYESSYHSSFPIFRDVSDTNPHFSAIQTLYEAKVMTGTGQGFFNPDQPMNRLQAAQVLMPIVQPQVEILPVDSAKSLASYPDAPLLPKDSNLVVAKAVMLHVWPTSNPNRLDPFAPLTHSDLITLNSNLQTLAQTNYHITGLHHKAHPALPSGSILSISPASALIQGQLHTGDSIVFMLAQSVIIPTTLSPDGQLPIHTRLRGTLTDVDSTGSQGTLSFARAITPSGQRYSLNASLPITFSDKTKVWLPGMLFQVTTRMVPPEGSIATPGSTP